jgi:hypothetical protein
LLLCGGQMTCLDEALQHDVSDASDVLRRTLAGNEITYIDYDDGVANFRAFIEIAGTLLEPMLPLQLQPPPSWAGVLRAARSFGATRYWYDRCLALILCLAEEEEEDEDAGLEIGEGSGAAVLQELSRLADVRFVCTVDSLYRPAWRDAGCARNWDGYAAMMAFVRAPAGEGRVFVDDEREDLVLCGAPHLVAAARAAGELRALLCLHRKHEDEADSRRSIHEAAWDQLEEAEDCGQGEAVAAIRECCERV